jgi:hypothetical protein
MTWTVCGDCTQLKGTVDRPNRSLALGLDGMYQACACDERDESTWRGYDFNLDRELCRVCALDVVPSGSKWSRWLCSTCVRLVGETNDRWGVCIIPVGRHSLVNGVGLRGGGWNHRGRAVRRVPAVVSGALALTPMTSGPP